MLALYLYLALGVKLSNYNINDPEITAMTEYVSSMFGAPVVTVELSGNHYTHAFNTSIEEYSSYINQWASKSHIANALGLPSSTDFTLRWVSQNFEFAKSFSEAYSEQAGVGGELPIRRSYFELIEGKQVYYLSDDIRVNEVMWQETPAILKYLTDPYNDAHWTTTEFGWAYMGNSFLYVTPVYYGIQMAAMNELRDRVRKSEFTYKVVPAPEDSTRVDPDYTGQTRNSVWIYPPPTQKYDGYKVWYFYWDEEDLNKYSGQTIGEYVANPGTMKLDEIPYSAFNSSGKRWVKQYTLAVSKEILGRIRSKFSELNIPDASVTLDGPELISEAQQTQQELKEYLKTELEEMDIQKLVQGDAETAEAVNKQLSYNPLTPGIW